MIVTANEIIELPTRRQLLAPAETNILLAIGEENSRIQIRQALIQAGYRRVSETANGKSAVRHLRSLPVDLLISDISLPHLDGWRLARMVRSGLFACTSDTPIIAVSATYSERIAQSTAKEFGINQFLSLPLQSHDELISIIEQLLNNRGAWSEKPSLLIVEDDPDTAILARRMLQTRFNIEHVTDGSSALDAWQQRRHDLVLLDVMLPKLAGPELLKLILKDQPSQAIVVMTADGSMERCEDVMFSGAVDFVPKPFRAEQLRQICDMAVRRNDRLETNQQFSEQTLALKTAQDHYHKIADAHQRLLDNLGSVVFELDATGRLRFMNQYWERFSQYRVNESLGRMLHDFVHTQDRRQFESIIEALGQGKKSRHELEIRLLDRHSETLWAEITLAVKRGPESGVEAIFGHLTNITDRKLAMQQLEHLAIHDSLTGLFNRRYFEISLEQIAAGSIRSGKSHALLYIDLDHFQLVNGTLSHRDGDIILKEVAELLGSRTRNADLLCRIGGDEFAMLLTHANLEQAVSVANSIIAVLNQYRYRRDEREISISTSIGISLIDGRQASGAECLVQADKASFVAKNRGRNLFHVYNPADKDSEELRQSIDWANRVRQAIGEDRLELYIQPILDLASGNINHYEALLRLHAPDQQETVAPAIFIPAVEKAGQIHILDRWVIKQAIALLAEHPWLNHLAINLSGRAFADPQLLPMVRNELEAHVVNPGRIIFEITETASVANISDTQRMIHQLRGLGCRFAIDDFGTGFCSFHYLRHLPADYLKIDGSYVRNMDENELDLAMVRSMNEIAHLLGKKTIAECVENDNILGLLKEIGVDYVQGHTVGGAAPLTHFIH